MDPTYRCDDMDMLHPKAVVQFKLLENRLIHGFANKETNTLFSVFETFRSPERQALMVKNKTSKAGPWSSAHQYGLAADFVPVATRENNSVDNHDWSWDTAHDWAFLWEEARRFELRTPIMWDKPHVQHKLYDKLLTAIA